jgi:hypothetical protein
MAKIDGKFDEKVGKSCQINKIMSQDFLIMNLSGRRVRVVVKKINVKQF